MTDQIENNNHERSKKGRWRWIILALLAVAAVGAGAVFTGAWDLSPAAVPEEAAAEAEPVASEPRTMQLHPSEVYTVERSDLTASLNFTGTIQPAQSADISAQVSGIATAVNVQAGQSVQAGQILAQIDIRDLELQLRQQQATRDSTEVQLEAAEQTLERTRSSAERGITPQSTLDAAIAEVDQLRATLGSLQSQVEQVQTNIERATIRAPFSGTVSARMVEPGQVVSSGSVLFSIVDLSRITVDALVPLSGAAQVGIGQTATLSVQGLSNMEFQARVDRISPVAVEGTRSITVYLTLENPEASLRGGMFVTGQIVTASSPDALSVPQRALLGEEDARYVLAVEEGELVRKDVEVTQVWSRLDRVEIASGIEDGDTVVAMPLSGLEAGQPVAIEG
ncbi:efflux RND transporter periplasmic adaptor subunit [Pelagibacterium sp. 26DY04]|uniref:efflux RND transporter periplasmic adaptor subunit n=1 Tax=Pelagibacterium sp. 26DY04 TaxID=2967130 RepID=UPI002814D5DF|nr:efflux RND transporter periplasmic adaptor subunit [Pelagibacterium sp. 26DY04]WMT86801.1 efflux RND transporter periplasmic adaptor subunit [Pelagibacterium sp. 26DY04]